MLWMTGVSRQSDGIGVLGLILQRLPASGYALIDTTKFDEVASMLQPCCMLINESSGSKMFQVSFQPPLVGPSLVISNGSSCNVLLFLDIASFSSSSAHPQS
jgi:hypothetical protein